MSAAPSAAAGSRWWTWPARRPGPAEIDMVMWVWINPYRYIFSGMNIHLPAILGFTRYQGFDPSPCLFEQWDGLKLDVWVSVQQGSKASKPGVWSKIGSPEWLDVQVIDGGMVKNPRKIKGWGSAKVYTANPAVSPLIIWTNWSRIHKWDQ